MSLSQALLVPQAARGPRPWRPGHDSPLVWYEHTDDLKYYGGSNARGFDGVNQYLTMNSHPDIEATSSFWVSQWFYHTANSGVIICSKGDVSTPATWEYSVQWSQSVPQQFDVSIGDGSAGWGTTASWTSAPNETRWFHSTAVVDHENMEVRHYVDGVLVATAALANITPAGNSGLGIAGWSNFSNARLQRSANFAIGKIPYIADHERDLVTALWANGNMPDLNDIDHVRFGCTDTRWPLNRATGDEVSIGGVHTLTATNNPTQEAGPPTQFAINEAAKNLFFSIAKANPSNDTPLIARSPDTNPTPNIAVASDITKNGDLKGTVAAQDQWEWNGSKWVWHGQYDTSSTLTSRFIDIPAVPTLQDFTAMVTVKLDDISATFAPWGADNDTPIFLGHYNNTSGAWRFFIRDSSNQTVLALSPTGTVVGQEYKVIWTWDATSKTAVVYLDGVGGTPVTNAAVNPATVAPEVITIGGLSRHGVAWGQGFPGEISDLCFLQRVATAQEIADYTQNSDIPSGSLHYPLSDGPNLDGRLAVGSEQWKNFSGINNQVTIPSLTVQSAVASYESAVDGELFDSFMQIEDKRLLLPGTTRSTTELPDSGRVAASTAPMAYVNGTGMTFEHKRARNFSVTQPSFSMPTHPDLQMTGSFFMSAWSFCTLDNEIKTIAGFAESGVNTDIDYLLFRRNAEDSYGFNIRYSPTELLGLRSADGSSAINVWEHVVAVVDVENRKARIYVNGMFSNEEDFPGVPQSSNPTFRVARRGDGVTIYDGNLCDIVVGKIPNIAREERDLVTDLYNYGIRRDLNTIDAVKYGCVNTRWPLTAGSGDEPSIGGAHVLVAQNDPGLAKGPSSAFAVNAQAKNLFSHKAEGTPSNDTPGLARASDSSHDGNLEGTTPNNGQWVYNDAALLSDSSGNKRLAHQFNAPLVMDVPTGMSGKSVDFLGGAAGDSRVNIAGLDTARSFAFWAKRSVSPGATSSGVFKYNGNAWSAHILSSGEIRIQVGGAAEATGQQIPLDSTWHHYVFTIEADNSPKLYFDGVDVFSGTVGTPPSGPQELVLGETGTFAAFLGQMKDWQAFNRTLTPAEVTAIKDNNGPPSDFIGRWEFNDSNPRWRWEGTGTDTTSMIRLKTPVSFALEEEFTVASFWKGPSTGGAITGDYNGNLGWRIKDSTTIEIRTSTSKDLTVPTLSPNTPYHFCWVRRAANSSVFVNGVESTDGPDAGNTHAITFDQVGNRVESFPIAQLWDHVIIRRALSDAEVLDLANGIIPADAIHLPLNDGPDQDAELAGTTAPNDQWRYGYNNILNDSSGNNLSGMTRETRWSQESPPGLTGGSLETLGGLTEGAPDNGVEVYNFPGIPTQQMTFAFWFRRIGSVSGIPFMGGDYTSGTGWYVRFLNGFDFTIYDTAGTKTIVGGPSSPVVGQWYRIVCVVDATHVRMYVDGVEVNSTPLTDPVDLNGNGKLWLGTTNNSLDRTMHANYRRFVVSERAWSPAEVANDFNNMLPSGSLGVWECDDADPRWRLQCWGAGNGDNYAKLPTQYLGGGFDITLKCSLSDGVNNGLPILSQQEFGEGSHRRSFFFAFTQIGTSGWRRPYVGVYADRGTGGTSNSGYRIARYSEAVNLNGKTFEAAEFRLLWDGSPSSDGLQIWMNGIRIDDANDDAGTFDRMYEGEVMHVGYGSTGSQFYHQGQIWDLVINGISWPFNDGPNLPAQHQPKSEQDKTYKIQSNGSYVWQGTGSGDNRYLITKGSSYDKSWNLDVIRQGTIRARVKLASLAADNTIFSFYRDDANRGAFNWNAAGEFVFGVRIANAWNTDCKVTYNTTDEWVDVCATHDGTTTRIYLNGVLSPNTSTVWWDDIGAIANSAIGVSFSGAGPVGGGFFNGELDDFRIYARPLTQDEITDLANQQDGPQDFFARVVDDTFVPSYLPEAAAVDPTAIVDLAQNFEGVMSDAFVYANQLTNTELNTLSNNMPVAGHLASWPLKDGPMLDGTLQGTTPANDQWVYDDAALIQDSGAAPNVIVPVEPFSFTQDVPAVLSGTAGIFPKSGLGSTVKQFTGIRSVCVWLKTFGYPATNAWAFDWAELGAAIYITSSGQIRGRYNRAGSGSTDHTMPLNTWVHVAIIHKDNGDFRVYLNGVEDTNSTANTGVAAWLFGLDVGWRNAKTEERWNGLIKDLQWFDREITQTELNNIVANTAPPTDQQGRWEFNDADPRWRWNTQSGTADNVQIARAGTQDWDVSAKVIFNGGAEGTIASRGRTASATNYMQFQLSSSGQAQFTINDGGGETVNSGLTVATGAVSEVRLQRVGDDITFTVNGQTANFTNGRRPTLMDVDAIGSRVRNAVDGSFPGMIWDVVIDGIAYDLDDGPNLPGSLLPAGTGDTHYITDPDIGDWVWNDDDGTRVVSIDDSPPRMAVPEMTVAAWINKKDLTTWGTIAAKFDDQVSNRRCWLFRVDQSTGFLRWLDSANGSTTLNRLTTAPIAAATWQHVVAVKVGTDVTFYLNGVAMSDDGQAVNGTLHQNAEPVTFGGYRAALTGDQFVGKISNGRLFNRALTAAEVADLHAGNTVPGAMMLTPLNEGQSGNTVVVGTPANRWEDQWFRKNHAVAPGPTARPIVQAEGLVFDGVDDILTSLQTLAADMDNCTVFLVADITTVGNVVVELGPDANATPGFYIIGADANQRVVLIRGTAGSQSLNADSNGMSGELLITSFRRLTGSGRLWRDGVQASVGSSAITGIADELLNIGSRFGGSSSSQLLAKELLVYPTGFADEKMDEAHDYFKRKYGKA